MWQPASWRADFETHDFSRQISETCEISMDFEYVHELWLTRHTRKRTNIIVYFDLYKSIITISSIEISTMVIISFFQFHDELSDTKRWYLFRPSGQKWDQMWKYFGPHNITSDELGSEWYESAEVSVSIDDISCWWDPIQKFARAESERGSDSGGSYGSRTKKSDRVKICQNRSVSVCSFSKRSTNSQSESWIIWLAVLNSVSARNKFLFYVYFDFVVSQQENFWEMFLCHSLNQKTRVDE